jgi:16S rRNA A1518/A1519 N6-dimethyltransferase RsmA/KsgA/DIM1 with predicted DNA glycosylase/AP lyase activity
MLGKGIDKKMENMPAGTHRLSDKTIIKVLQSIELQSNDIVWEIGCGNPVLGLSFSHQVESNNVTLTDLTETINFIKAVLCPQDE